MKIADVLQKTKNVYALDLFTAATIAFVEAQLYERGDKVYLRCQVRGKDFVAKPEEIVRQLWIHRLLAYYKYPFSRLRVEYPITFGRDTSKRADTCVRFRWFARLPKQLPLALRSSSYSGAKTECCRLKRWLFSCAPASFRPFWSIHRTVRSTRDLAMRLF